MSLTCAFDCVNHRSTRTLWSDLRDPVVRRDVALRDHVRGRTGRVQAHHRLAVRLHEAQGQSAHLRRGALVLLWPRRSLGWLIRATSDHSLGQLVATDHLPHASGSLCVLFLFLLSASLLTLFPTRPGRLHSSPLQYGASHPFVASGYTVHQVLSFMCTAVWGPGLWWSVLGYSRFPVRVSRLLPLVERTVAPLLNSLLAISDTLLLNQIRL